MKLLTMFLPRDYNLHMIYHVTTYIYMLMKAQMDKRKEYFSNSMNVALYKNIVLQNKTSTEFRILKLQYISTLNVQLIHLFTKY